MDSQSLVSIAPWTLLLGCAIAEKTGIYGFAAGLLLIFVAPKMFINLL